jgi:maltose alpha-D-glucosyltransferase/alpha-amylase
VELVPNHTSDRHPWFIASRDPHHPEHGRYRDYYVWSESDSLYADARIIFLDTEESNWTFDPERKAFFWHRFFHHQPDLNYDNPEVQRAMLRVIQFWIDQGADGIRVDAPPYLYEREGTSCENLPETHAYCKRLRSFVDAYAPGTLLISEANQWPEDVREYFGDGDEFHMNFHFPLMPRIFMALAQADRKPLEEILARTPPLPPACQWGTFLRNHDELTLEMVTPEERRFMWDFYAPEPRMPHNLGIRRRLAPLLGNSLPRIQVAHSILLTIIGSPFLYYGDEIGMGDNIELEDRDGVRTPMQWDGTQNAGFSPATPDSLFAPVITEGEFEYRRVNVEAQRGDPGSLLNWLRLALQLRREHPAFSRGELTLLDFRQRSVLAYLRQHASRSVLVLNNLSDQPVQVELGKIETGPGGLFDLFRGEEVGADLRTTESLELEPYGFRWLRVD